jgi:hypothetical protein
LDCIYQGRTSRDLRPRKYHRKNTCFFHLSYEGCCGDLGNNGAKRSQVIDYGLLKIAHLWRFEKEPVKSGCFGISHRLKRITIVRFVKSGRQSHRCD